MKPPTGWEFSRNVDRRLGKNELRGEVREAAKAVNLEKVLDSGPAPVVAITFPPAHYESAADLVLVEARLSDEGKGVGGIEWRVNGVTAAVSAKPPGAGSDLLLVVMRGNFAGAGCGSATASSLATLSSVMNDLTRRLQDQQCGDFFLQKQGTL